MAENMTQGGVQLVTPIAPQIVYLDFDGELTRYDGEILTIDNVEVQHSLLTTDRIENILSILNEKYASQNVKFVTELPASGEYSTIYIGKTSAFDAYGTFAGLAETIDHNNANKTDNAFVNLDSSATDSEIITTISHETDHLLGTLDHGGEKLEKYADDDKDPGYIYYYYKNNETLKGNGGGYYTLQHYPSSRTITHSSYQSDGGDDYVCVGTRYNSAQNYTFASWGHLYISSGGVANETTINSGGRVYVSSGGVANETTINSSGWVYISSGGVANKTTINSRGWLDISAGGVANEIILFSGGGFCDWGQQGETAASITAMTGSGLTGTATNLNGRGSLYISSGGVANETTINSSGWVRIYSGGVANETTINSWGSLYVSSGGVANETTINSLGNLYISSGGEANETTINSSGWVGISSGGVANETTINSGGFLYIFSGGVANETTINYRGILYISSGGEANEIILSSGGKLGTWGQQGETAASITAMTGSGLTGTATNLNGSGSLDIISGGVANETTINLWGRLYISSGGVANETTINSGSMWIRSGGVANETTINGGYLQIFSGGVANSTTINERLVDIFSGGVANSTTINSMGWLRISSGGVANETTINAEGIVYISSGGMANETTINSGSMWIRSGGVANETTINGGYLSIFSGGVANSTTINSGGSVYISSGGVANETTINSGGVSISSGGVANSTTINGGYLSISSGGVANSTTINGGYLSISSGGVANETTINSYGNLNINSGGVANEIILSSGGRLDTWRQQGETAASITAMTGSGLTGTATNLNGSGTFRISSGGVANETTINSGGRLYISSGGVANETTINSGGSVHISSGGVANNTTVHSGGSIYAHSGAVLQDDVILGGTMAIYGEINTAELEEFTFAVDENSSTDTGVMLNNIALLNDFDNFHISVTSDLAGGRYKLAGNAANFSQDVTLTVDGASAGVFQWSDGEYNSILIGEEYYTLKLDRDMNLCLRPTSNISLSYSIDTIDQIVYYGLREEEFDGVVMKVPYSATATITVDNDIPDGIYEFVSELEEIEGAELEFQIEVIGGIPVYLSTNKQMCINGTKISENADTSTWEIDVDDFILTEKIKQSMTVAPIPQYGASIGTFIPAENTESKDVTLSRNSDHSDANKNILGSGNITHSHMINGQKWQITLTFSDDNSVWIVTGTEQFLQKTDIVWVQEGSKLKVTIKIPATQEIIPLELLENPQTPPESYYLTCTFDVSEDDFGNKKLITKKITISDTKIKDHGTLPETLDCIFVPSQDLNCWIAVAANILHDGGYIVDVSAQECFEYWSERYLLSRKASQKDSIKRVFDDFGIGSVWANLSDNIETGLIHLSKNPTNIGCLTITDGDTEHGITCYSVDWEGKSVTVADSDRYLTGIILTNYRITQDPKNGKWYIQSYGGKGKNWEITGIETVIPKIEDAPTLNYKKIEPDRLSGKTFVKNSYGAISQGSVTTVSGSVFDAVVLSGGTLEIASGAVGDTITLNNMAALKLNSGASVSGEISTNGGTISTEAGINFADDASINFDLISLEGKESAMLDDLAHVAGVALTVTVEAFQAEGRYVLANGVADFDGEITVYGDFGTSYTLKLGFFIGELGTLSVGDELKIGNQLYSLDIENDSLVFTVSEAPLAVWDISADTTCLTESSVTVTAIFSDDVTIKEYSLDSETWNRYDDAGVVVSGNGTLYFRGADANGDYSDVATYDVNNIIIRHNGGSADGVTLPAGHDGYLIEYSKDNFENYLQIETDSGKLNTYGLAAGSYNWQFWAQDTSEWWLGNDIVVTSSVSTATNWTAKADGNTDLFFANADGTWIKGYAAEHHGILYGWDGTGERVSLKGKNQLSDIFAGSSDANILVMTDDANGDTLFVDDMYSIFGDQARIAQIDEIRAGAGDDVVDMTSQRFAYNGDGMTIYGGLGNDTIWSNNGSNILFGDGGNDRIVGGGDNDVIIGGSGNDSMHGGGGDDIFCFGDNWGVDTIEQLANGSVTLWFENGSVSNWNASTLTYSDGINSIKVSGVDNVTLKFGDVDTAVAGAFLNAASEKIFEDKNKGMIA